MRGSVPQRLELKGCFQMEKLHSCFKPRPLHRGSGDGSLWFLRRGATHRFHRCCCFCLRNHVWLCVTHRPDPHPSVHCSSSSSSSSPRLPVSCVEGMSSLSDRETIPHSSSSSSPSDSRRGGGKHLGVGALRIPKQTAGARCVCVCVCVCV